MENYKAIALQYLKLNKRRTILTILGTAITVVILYIMLNLGFSYIDLKRAEVIKEGDYEMLFYTETPEQIRAIMNDSLVKRAYVGGYYLESDEKQLEQALYVTGDSPYRIDKNFEYLKDTYEVEGHINQDLAAFYMQGYKGNDMYVLILAFFLVSYIFALFGVGVIRNSIQLSLFEQIKDYGNLRCIGATIGQLRAIIYLQGAIMEIAGIMIGVVIGQLLMSFVGILISFEMSFHVIPVILIIVAYFFDLYFAMEENCKLVTGMSPISALKGEFRIRKEKIKRRKKSIYGRLFGIEGDYAYKNLMRSPGRFFRSVGAMFLSIAALIAFLGVTTTFDKYNQKMNDLFQYYQVFYSVPLTLDTSVDKAQKRLPSVEWMKNIAEIDEVTAVKRMYQTQIMTTDASQIYSHVKEGDLLWEEPVEESGVESENTIAQSDTDIYESQINCYGYDEEDYARYEDELIEGTLDISDNGIVIVNGAKLPMEEEESLGVNWEYYNYTSFHVGDTIDIVDTEKMRSMVIERIESVPKGESYSYPDIINESRNQLIQQGDYKTYIVEGILKQDNNYMSIMDLGLAIVLPMERYYEMTGMDESCVTGMRYHIEGDLSQEELDTITDGDVSKEQSEGYYITPFVKSYDESEYPYMVSGINEIKQLMKCILAIALFIAVVSSVNIINTTASNIHMRRKEFAQLRVIGVSQKRLMKMVLLEGIISTIVANFWGFLVGNLVSYGVFIFAEMIFGLEYTIPWLGMLLGLLFSMAVLCGSVYVPMRTMKQNLAGDLAASGE